MLEQVKDKYRIDLWEYQDFLAFVLIYAAYADMEVVEEEIDAIERRVGHEKFVQARRIMDKLNDSERIDLILSFREKYFPTKEDHDKLYSDMKEIFLADGNYNQLEKAILMYLKHIL